MAATTSPTPGNTANPGVVIKELSLPVKSRDVFLSPDGALIAAVVDSDKEICIYTISGQKQPCAAYTTLDFNSLRWSPDSHYLAFTENLVQILAEPDIWLIDATNGKLTNLTDDNLTKLKLGDSDPASEAALLILLLISEIAIENNRKIMFKRIVSSLQLLRWPLQTKLGLALGILLVCFIINGLISLFFIYAIQDSQDKQALTTSYLERIQRYALIYNTGQLKTYSDAVFIGNNTNIFDNFATIISDDLQKRDKTIPLLGSTAFDAQFEQAYLAAAKNFKEVEDLARANQLKTAADRWPTYLPAFQTVTDLLANQDKLLTQTRLVDVKAVNDELRIATFRIAAIATVSVILALCMLLLLQHVIVRPLNRLQSGLVNLSQGRFDRLDGQVINRDEIGKLATSFQAAVSSMEKVVQGVQITGSLRNVTEKLAVVSKQQQSGTAEQITALTQVLASMQELGQAAAQIANTTSDVAGLSSQTLVQIERVAQSGINSQERTVEVTEVVNLTITRIEEVGHQVEEFSRSMTHLNNQAAAINKVVELLGSIAEEVHLLALNAAIEAASAGEYGERFRVVAREIKDLAHRANRSTHEAQELVSGVQQSSQSTSLMVEKGRSLISTIYDANSQLNLSLNGLEVSSQEVAEAVMTLLTMANQVNERTEEIKQATQQQHTASEQVLVAIRSVSEVADQTASSTDLIASSAAQLDNLIHQLGRVLSQVQAAI